LKSRVGRLETIVNESRRQEYYSQQDEREIEPPKLKMLHLYCL
jgi:hypothetical protein